MTLPTDLQTILKGFSGPFASWFLHVPSRSLFDAGEGITSFLGNRTYKVERVFLSHVHLDHVSGLLSFLTARQAMRGQRDKPVTVYFSDDDRFADLIDTVGRRLPDDAPVEWKCIASGDRIAARNFTVEPFEAFHGLPAVGYRLLQTRTRLKPEFQQLTQAEIKEARSRKHAIEDEFQHPVFAYTGDTDPGLDPSLFRNCDLLVHEATFVDAADRRGEFHSTIEDAVRLATECGARRLLLHHFSQRYKWEFIAKITEDAIQRVGFTGKSSLLMGYTEPPRWYE